MWFGTSEGRKTKYVKTENQTFGKQILLGIADTIGTHSGLRSLGPAEFPSPLLGHIFADISEDSSLLEAGHLPNSLGQLKRR